MQDKDQTNPLNKWSKELKLVILLGFEQNTKKLCEVLDNL